MSKSVKTKLWVFKGQSTRATYALTNGRMRMVAICDSGHIGSWINSFQNEQALRATLGEPIIVNNFKEAYR